MSTETVTAEIAAERVRQIVSEGNTPDWDDEEHGEGGLALAAACYATPILLYRQEPDLANAVTFQDPWPWAERHDKRPADGNVILPNSKLTALARRRQLVIAAALLVAEIERLDRAAAKTPKP